MECVVLAVACLNTYWLVTSALSRVYSLSRDDDLLGGMWAVLATIFVLRDSFGKSVAAGVSRMAATSVSFVLCLIYLAFLPFHPWALAVLVGASALAVMLLGRPGHAVTAGITTAVIMVVAAVSPQHAWQQPILRLADTVVGVAVGALAAWTVTRVKRLLSARSVPAAPAKVKIDLTERAAFNIRTSNGREGQWNRPPSASAPSTMRGGRCTTGACHSSRVSACPRHWPRSTPTASTGISSPGWCSAAVPFGSPSASPTDLRTAAMTERANWLDAAACRDADPDLFFPIGTSGPALFQIDKAKGVCGTCAARIQCLAWALKTEVSDGVWGGTTADERRTIRSQRTDVTCSSDQSRSCLD